MQAPSKLVNAWFKHAREDLNDAKALWEVKGLVSKRTIAFLCQQSTEKSIKGLLQFYNHKILKTHDIKLLAQVIIEKHPELKELMIDAIELTPYAVEYRYPEAAEKSLDLEDIESALKVAENVYAQTKSKIPFSGGIE